MAQDKEYFAFISYQRKDEEWADRLRNKLEHYRLPSSVRKQDASLPKEIRPIFRDVLELAGGVLAKEIETALQNSKFLIVICSPNSAKSPWVNKEIQTFTDLGREDRIIPFIIDGTPFSDNEETECFPPALRSLKGEKELLGININELSRDAASIKVVARMFGLKFDTLWQRYEREKKRKRWMMIGGSLLFALVSLGIGTYIAHKNRELDARNKEVVVERDRANSERNRAEKTSDSLKVAFDSIAQQNILIQQQRNDLDKSNNDLQLSNNHLAKEKIETQKQYAKFIAQKANELMDDNDFLSARRLLLDVLPKSLPGKDYPYVLEVEQALRRSFESNFGTIKDRLGSFHTVLLSPNGNRIVSCNSNENIKIRNSYNGLLINTIPNNAFSPSIIFSPDGKLYVSNKGLINVWDVDKCEMIRSINLGKGSIMDIDQCNRVLSITSVGKKYQLEISNGLTGQSLSIIPTGITKYISSALFLSEDNVVTSSLDDSIRVWNVKSKKMIRGWKAHENGVAFLCTNKEKSVLASGEFGLISFDRPLEKKDSLRLWDVKTGLQIKAFPVSVKKAVFSPDGNNIIASNGNDIIIINSHTGKIEKTLVGHKQTVSELHLDEQGKVLVSSSSDGTIRIWNDYMNEPFIEGSRTGSIYTVPVSFYPDGSKFVIVPVDTIMVFTTNPIKMLKKIGYRNTPMFSSLRFNKDGSKFITTGSVATVWDAINFHPITDIRTFRPQYAEISPNGNKALTLRNDNAFHIWDISKNDSIISKAETTFTIDNKGKINFASFSPDGKRIVSAHDDGLIRIWSINNHLLTDSIKGHEKSVNSTLYSPNGKLIVSASADNTIKIWDVKTKQCIRTLSGHNSEVCYAEFDSESKYVISTSFDNTAKIWDVSSGTILKTFFNQGKTAVISPNGQRIIVVDGRGSFRIVPNPSFQELSDKARLQFATQYGTR